MRLWRKVIVGILIGVVLALSISWLMLDRIVQTSIEYGASSALGVEAHIDRLKLDLFDGHLQIDGMTIDNPKGFNSPFLVKANQFDLKIKPSSLMSSTIELQKFELKNIEINLEQNFINNNVVSIKNNLAQTEVDRKDRGDRGEKKLKADHVSIGSISANVYFAPLGGVVKPQVFQLSGIELNGITDRNSGGIVMGELVSKITSAIFAVAVKQLAPVSP